MDSACKDMFQNCIKQVTCELFSVCCLGCFRCRHWHPRISSRYGGRWRARWNRLESLVVWTRTRGHRRLRDDEVEEYETQLWDAAQTWYVSQSPCPIAPPLHPTQHYPTHIPILNSVSDTQLQCKILYNWSGSWATICYCLLMWHQ